MNLTVAYLDPGAGSLLLQALVGGFSGIAVLARYLWIQYTGRLSVKTSVTADASTSA